MNTFLTLFGGLAAVIVLYALGGFVRALSPMLRAALAGLIPLVVYFVYVFGRGPGMDVVAIHISVYLAAALVLYAMTQFRLRSTGKLHWAPKLLTVFFVGLVVLNASLLYMSSKGLPGPIAQWWLGKNDGTVHSGFSGVVSHGQNAAKAISSELKETHRESVLGWRVEVSGLEASTAAQDVVVRVRDRTGLPIDGLSASLRLLRPGAASPAAVRAFGRQAPGVYGATLTLPAGGRWLVDIRIEQAGETRFHTVQELVVP